MKLFEKRPLCLILCILLGGFSLFSSTSLTTKLTVLICSLVVFAFSFFIKLDKSRLILVRILIVVFCLSVILSHFYFSAFYPSDYYGEEIEITGEILEINIDGEYYDEITVKTEKINGKKAKYKLLVYTDKDEYQVECGSLVTISGKLVSFTDNDGFDTWSYYTSKGYAGKLESVSNVSLLDSREQSTIRRFFLNLKYGVVSRFERICDNDTASLFSALLTGERKELDASLRLNFERCGITHILALSGMHLVIMAGVLSLLLSRLNKKIRLGVISLFTLFYMALTGFSPSVTRAGIMLIVSSLLFLLAHSKDSATNLFISVFLILLITPYAVYDLSLWLSAFATLGIIVYSELASKRKRNEKVVMRIIVYVCDALLVSVFAISSTLILTLYSFDCFSVIAPFTTIIFGFIITPYMYLGIIVLILGSVLPFLSKIASHYTLFIARGVDFFSDYKSIYASYNVPLVKPLIIALVLAFLLFTVLYIKKNLRAVALITLLFISINLVAFVGTNKARTNEDILYYSYNNSCDFITVKSEKEISVIALSKGTRNEAYDLYSYLTDNRITYIDRLIIPYGISNNEGFVYTLLTEIYVDTLIIATPRTSDENKIAAEYALMLSDMPTKLDFIDKSSPIKTGEYYIHCILGSYDTNSEALLVIDGGNGVYTYASRKLFVNAYTEYLAYYNISDTVIIGKLGSSNETVSYKMQKVKRILTSDNTLFSDEAIEFYNSKDVRIEYDNDCSLIH